MSTESQKEVTEESGVNSFLSFLLSQRWQRSRDSSVAYYASRLEKHEITRRPPVALRINQRETRVHCSKKWMSNWNGQTIGEEMSQWGWRRTEERQDRGRR